MASDGPDPGPAFRSRAHRRGVVRQVAARKGFKIVGAVDIDPAKVGRDLGEVAGVGRRCVSRFWR